MQRERYSAHQPLSAASLRAPALLACWVALAACSAPPVVVDGPAAAELRPVARYGVVIDAGSSGTRLHIFRTTVEVPTAAAGDVVTRCVGCPSPVPAYRPALDAEGHALMLKTEPGLSSFAGDPEAGAESLGPLLDYAAANIPAEAWAQTRVHVLATAGLRLVGKEQRGAILRAVAAELKRRGVSVGQVAVIGGDQEAAFAWGTVNALIGPKGPSTGVLDLGGGSTQLAFEDSDHHLHTKSWLGWGQDEGFRRVWEPACLPSGARVTDDGHAEPLRGTGDFATCRRAIAALAASDPAAPTAEVPADMPFVAISGYYYTADFFGVAAPLNLAELERRATTFCAADFETSQAEHSEVPAKYLSKYCYGAAHISVLTERLGFASDTRAISAVSNIGGFDAGWPLGALLSVESNAP